jgi:drug/metabolite transporter (DMT)-like permease
MSWILFAAIGPVLNAAANHIDKYSISKYLKGGETGALVIFSALFNLVALPVIYIVDPHLFALSYTHMILLMVNDMLIVLAMLLYFFALERDEASYVVPFYQTIPVFGFILGFFVLGETITGSQSIGAGFLLVGALLLSLELGLGRLHIKYRVALYMMGASALYAINSVLFKYFALDVGFWPAVFWGCVGKVGIGLIFLMCLPRYRKQFRTLISKNTRRVLGLNAFSESLFIIAETTTSYAFTLASVGLVLLVNALQPVFVFIGGILLTLFLPHFGTESLSRRLLAQKMCGIGLLVIGTMIIAVY